MLDQSFSTENFRLILDYENRKGVYLEGKYFPEIKKITEDIKKCNAEIKEKKRTATKEEFYEFKKVINEKIELLKEQKEEKLKVELHKISEKIIHKKFRIELKENDQMGDKPIYTMEDKPDNFFALKQIQYNFRKLYKVKQASRFAIMSQVKALLDDRFPKFVIRTDIQNFYESVPHDMLLQKLNEENLLTFYSKKIIFQILAEYKKLSGNNKGLPRGIGVSAYLAELYMRDIDNSIKSLPTVSYYARYVDDIIIVFTPLSTKDPRDYLNKIDEIIEQKYLLTRNKLKTKDFDLIDSNKNCIFEYLGYSIQFGNGPVNLELPQKKEKRYKNRIDLLLNSYVNFSKVNEKRARELLVKRIRFLTGNTRLLNNKKNILVGVYFSNSLLTNISTFIGLDKYLTHKIQTLIKSPHLVKRLSKYRFQDGFNLKRFSPFTTNELSEIMDVWDHE